MSKIIFSRHAIDQMNLRDLTISAMENILFHPDLVLQDIEDVTIFQKVVFEDNKRYLYRVFVKTIEQTYFVITAYKTSKIEKYENKIR